MMAKAESKKDMWRKDYSCRVCGKSFAVYGGAWGWVISGKGFYNEPVCSYSCMREWERTEGRVSATAIHNRRRAPSVSAVTASTGEKGSAVGKLFCPACREKLRVVDTEDDGNNIYRKRMCREHKITVYTCEKVSKEAEIKLSKLRHRD